MLINTMLFMIPGHILQNRLQIPQHSLGFIRFWEVVSPNSQNVVFPMVSGLLAGPWTPLVPPRAPRASPRRAKFNHFQGGGLLGHLGSPEFTGKSRLGQLERIKTISHLEMHISGKSRLGHPKRIKNTNFGCFHLISHISHLASPKSPENLV